MLKKIRLFIQIAHNMGWRYFTFRIKHELLRRTGLMKHFFPTNYDEIVFPSIHQWRTSAPSFFFENRKQLAFPKNKTESLKRAVDDILAGKIRFFSSTDYDLGPSYDWLTNPSNQYKYDIHKHWTEIPDFSPSSGDIKYVWEKSRFSYLYTIIRYDYHFEADSADFVFQEIISWIDANPLNQGPNYRCSQEISIRLLNWTFALYFYRQSSVLTDIIFQKILNSIYWQLHHVYHNIDFSRIAVRNNHAITETLTLYLTGILFPFFPNSNQWKTDGKRWFEEEIAYQIYEDGTFLQFSMNYHRVVVQLLTWALVLSKRNNEVFKPIVYERTRASIYFLRACQVENGWLPNYGANDGALFFPLNDCHYRDYRPQLQALASYFGIDLGYGMGNWAEDCYWFAPPSPTQSMEISSVSLFLDGGYYVFRWKDTLSFLRCGSYRDRPVQADNLHLDIWIGDENILRDAGSYRYNTDPTLLRFFNGTNSHNTVMLGDYDQMEKGPRFVWLNWSQAVGATCQENAETIIVEGSIRAFNHVQVNIIHHRKIVFHKLTQCWEVTDTLTHHSDLPMHQIWNPSEYFYEHFTISASDEFGQEIVAQTKTGWYSGLYGLKEPTVQFIFSTNRRTIHTIIGPKTTSTLT